MADDTITITIPDAKKAAVYASFNRTYGSGDSAINNATTFKAYLVKHVRQTITNDERMQASIAGGSNKNVSAWGDLRGV
jgi:hypothetical protein